MTSEESEDGEIQNSNVKESAVDSCFCGYLRGVQHDHDELVEYKCLAFLLTLDSKI